MVRRATGPCLQCIETQPICCCGWPLRNGDPAGNDLVSVPVIRANGRDTTDCSSNEHILRDERLDNGCRDARWCNCQIVVLRRALSDRARAQSHTRRKAEFPCGVATRVVVAPVVVGIGRDIIQLATGVVHRTHSADGNAQGYQQPAHERRTFIR